MTAVTRKFRVYHSGPKEYSSVTAKTTTSTLMMAISSFTALMSQDNLPVSVLYTKLYAISSTQIYEGLFWEKFFFFSTKTAIYFLQVTGSDVIMIKVGDSTCTV